MKFEKIVLMFALVILVSSFVLGAETVGQLEATVCCEKTNDGLFCQNVPQEDCQTGKKALPTACESTAFCSPGYCFDSTEGTCLDNVPQMVCNENGGIWSADKPAQCDLGCCVLGDQASFVTLTRCKRLSSFLGLETNYNAGIGDEVQCLLAVTADEKGACVFVDNPAEAQPTCSFVKKSECTPEQVGLINIPEKENSKGVVVEEEIVEGEEEPKLAPGEVKFYPGTLCSADELGTECGPSQETACLPGKEEVYFVDTCGNPANIYDASRVNDKEYWSKIKDKGESCKPNSGNENSQTCGNCNYLLGSFCREGKATYGNNVCADLNCVDEETGEQRIHGESWCVSDATSNFAPPMSNEGSEILNGALQDALTKVNSGGGVGAEFLGASGGPVGSRFYRKLCNNGEIVVEPCADFRQEECLENSFESPLGTFTEAACRVNRWQDCTAQKKKVDCNNFDVRDCTWMDGIEYTLMGGATNGSTTEGSSLSGVGEAVKEIKSGDRDLGACVPKNPPGLNFWTGSEAAGICSQANAACPVTYEKGLIGSDWECVENCECLPGGELELKRAQLCMAIADCGPKVNFVGSKGLTKGYKITQEDVDEDD
jgi:hypothetical protein